MALLLPGADARGAEDRAAELGRTLASASCGGPLHLVCEPAGGHPSAASWCDAALGARA